jgi:hypothetical protein
VREVDDDGELVSLSTKLTLRNSIALTSAMDLTGDNEVDTVNRAIGTYAMLIARADTPDRPLIGVRIGLGRRVWYAPWIRRQTVELWQLGTEAEDDDD